MTPNELQPYWDNFKRTHGEKTVLHVESILGEEISQDAFCIAHKRTCKSGRAQCGRDLYKYLVKHHWILPDNSI